MVNDALLRFGREPRDRRPCAAKRQAPRCLLRDREGAVALEGLAMVILLIVIWSSSHFVQYLYATKWLTVWQARSNAWQSAMNCGADKAAKVDGLYEKLEAKGVSDTDPCATDQACLDVDGLSANAPSPESVPDWFATSPGEDTQSKDWTNPLTHVTRPITSHFIVTCNEPRFRDHELDLRNVSIADLAKQTIDKLF